MAEKMIAPRTGEGVEELFVVNWIKQEGDQVEEMEALVRWKPIRWSPSCPALLPAPC